MSFFAVDPEDLGTRLLQDLALLLDRRGVDPVLGIQDASLAVLLRRQHPLDAGQAVFECILFRKTVAVEVVASVTQIAGQRLLDNGKLVALECRDGHFLVTRHQHAAVDHVHVVDQRFQGLVGADTASRGILGSLLPVQGVDAFDLHVGPVDPANRLVVKTGRKTRTDNARPNALLVH